jgi:hypothetical protein
MVAAVAAHAVDQDVQVDILMSKIINAQKEGRAADALPSMAKLESMEPTLKAPLSEGFHFLYITTLDETGDHANALRRANVYIEKFGKKGRNYAKVVDMIGRLEDVVAQENKVANERAEAEKAKAEAERVRLQEVREGRSPQCKELGMKLEELEHEYKRVQDRWDSSDQVQRHVKFCSNANLRSRFGFESKANGDAYNYGNGNFSTGTYSCQWGDGTWDEEKKEIKREYSDNNCRTMR